MKCVNHAEVDAIGVCNRCGKNVCEACQVRSAGEMYCKECVAEKLGGEKKQKKSPVLAAVLSLCFGGLGQIYNGQPGKGLLIFFTSILIIPWIYGVVDAYNTAEKINSGTLVVRQRPGCMISALIAMILVPICIVLVAIFAALAIPSFIATKTAAQANLCSFNLKTISDAKKQYVLENKLSDKSAIPWADDNGVDDGDGIPDVLETYFTYPIKCVAGGKYDIALVGEDPKCSIGKNHVLKESDK